MITGHQHIASFSYDLWQYESCDVSQIFYSIWNTATIASPVPLSENRTTILPKIKGNLVQKFSKVVDRDWVASCSNILPRPESVDRKKQNSLVLSWTENCYYLGQIFDTFSVFSVNECLLVVTIPVNDGTVLEDLCCNQMHLYDQCHCYWRGNWHNWKRSQSEWR